MGSSLDALNAPQSLTQRRQAASNLPSFELPPPSNLQFTAQSLGHKFPPISGSHHNQHHPSIGSVGNLLTPPSNSASESGSSSANLPNGTNPNAHGMPVLPYTPFWQGPGSTPGFNTGLTPQPWQNGSLFTHRSMFSPIPSIMRHDPNSPSTGNHSQLPPPPYDISGHSYQNQVQLSSPPISANTAQQQQQQQQHHHHHQAMANAMMQGTVRPPSQASPISPADISTKPASTPSLYTSMTPQQPNYGYQSSTPVTQSPHSQSAPASTISPPLHQGSMPQIQQHNHFIKPPYPSYSLPAMPGPTMTNVGNPNNQMSMVGGMQLQMLPLQYNSGIAANQHMAFAPGRANSPQQPPTADRPFKCDECPQSFNRNHDLKRHKRIHLAVKPFPCLHCDKSFSRKDALKRHILVKGCGKSGSPDNSLGDGVKSDSGSDGMNESGISAAA